MNMEYGYKFYAKIPEKFHFQGNRWAIVEFTDDGWFLYGCRDLDPCSGMSDFWGENLESLKKQAKFMWEINDSDWKDFKYIE